MIKKQFEHAQNIFEEKKPSLHVNSEKNYGQALDTYRVQFTAHVF